MARKLLLEQYSVYEGTMQTKIIFEDNHVLVCYKPAGLATQSGRVGQADVVSELKNYLATLYLGVVHRLDQPVEGLLVFAKNPKAAAHLTKQLSAGSLNKQYYARVCGKVEPKEGELVDYLIKDGNLAKVVDAGASGAKKAVLQYKVVSEEQVADGRRVTLLDIHIDTGRFHQIRVQMSHAGWPLLGDSKYGTEESLALSRERKVRNVALCAYRVEFIHPVTGKHHQYELKAE